MRSTHLVTPLDRERAESCIVSAVGPMAIPPVADVRRALLELARLGPHTRVGLQPSATSLRWRYAPEELADSVEVLDPVALDGLAELMSTIARAYRGEGIRLYIAGDFLLIAVSHGLCDARLLLLVQNVLVSGVIPEWATKPAKRALLSAVSVKWFGTEPRRLLKLLRIDRKHANVAVESRVAADLEPAKPTLRWISIPPATRAHVRERMAANAPKATEATAWFSLISKSLVHNGIDIAESVVILADGRRYGAVAEGYLGNFAVGLEFDFPAPFDPEALSHRVQDALAAGRPLAAMGMAAIKSLAKLRGGRGHVAVPERPIVSFSDIGRAVDERALPWRSDERAYIATTEGIGYNGISFILVEIGRAILVQCSFNAMAHDPAAIEAALSSLCTRSADTFVGSN